MENWQNAIVLTDSIEVYWCFDHYNKYTLSVMKSFEHFTRSKALKSRVSLDTASDVEPDDVTPESGKFGHRKVASQGCEGPESLPLQLAGPPSAPAPAEG